MPCTPATLKYLKVQALAQRGDPGERDNAQRILRRLEREDPGIREAAEKHLREKDRKEGEGVRQAAPPGGPPRGGGWEDVFNFVKTAATGAYDFAQTAADAYRGRALVEEHVRSYTRATNAGNVVVGLKMPLAAFNQASRLNLIQKHSFRQAMHEALEEELDGFLGQD